MIVRMLVFALTVLQVEVQPMRSTWTVRDNLPLDRFVVQAHRGAGELSEENTLESFELGWKLNCIPEADLRTTKDGVIVAFHDSTFSRVVKDIPDAMKTKGVKDVTFHDLSKLDVGSWKGDRFTGRRVSKMSDIFAMMQSKPDRKLYLDIKNVDLEALATLVKEYKVDDQVILASTKYELIRRWKSLVPKGTTLLWMGGTEEALNKRFDELRAAHFADVTQLQIHTHLPEGVTTIKRDAVNPFKESDAFLIARGEELRKQGILFQTLPYGGSTPEVYVKLLDLGLMSFATDHPEVTWAAVKAYYAEGK